MNNRSENHQGSELKIGILVNGYQVDPYVHDFVAWAQSQPDMEVSHAVIMGPAGRAGDSGYCQKLLGGTSRRGILQAFKRQVDGKLFQWLMASEARSLKRSGIHTELLESRDLRDLVPQMMEVCPLVSPSGFVYRLREEDLARVRAEHFDVLLRFCDGILKGDILEAARHGVITFHHGDTRINRGGPPAFWEVYRRQSATGFIVQQLTEEPDGGKVLFRGWSQTQTGWLLNQAELFTVSYYYLRGLLQALAKKGELTVIEKGTPYSQPLYRTPGAGPILRYQWRKLRRSVMHRLARLRGLQLRWGVAFQRGHWRGAVLHRGTVIEAPAGHFIADPFVIRRDDRDYVFLEDLDFAYGRGIITVYELRDGKAQRLGVALEEDFHLSFPYLFEYQGDLYMCPESCGNRDIRLYRCTDFPLSWELVGQIFDNIDATDTMIFPHEGRWWLFTNENSASAMDYGYELSIYHSDDPLGGNWHSHNQNPIYVDPRRARNGGLLEEDGELYRVNQVQDLGVYGRAAAINRIAELTPERYREERVCEIEPAFFPGIFAAHHMHGNERYTVYDFCRRENPGKQ
jgi:hypothetical protein